MKGALRLLLLLGLAAIGLFLARGIPRSVTLVYDLEDPAEIRLLEVDVRNAEGALRHAEYRFPDGAPRQVRQDVRLPDGSYEVLLRVSRAGGRPGAARLPLLVAESGPVVLAVHDRPARAD